MKNISEDIKIYDAYMQINLCIAGLLELQERISKVGEMIDKVTGFADERLIEDIETMKSFYVRLIEAKKVLGCDSQQDKLALDEISVIESKLKKRTLTR